jgi:hypothetical protein
MAVRRYRILLPRDVMIRAACQDAGCESWRYGWQTICDTRTALGDAQAAYIRQASGRTFTEASAGPGIVVFRFEPRQRCFADHQSRPAVFLAGPTRHARLGDWIEDLDEHAGRLADGLRRG